MTHDFVINTENVNGYKYRILTEGIDINQYERNPVVLYLHNREHYGDDRGKEVIGRCVKLTKKDNTLIASIEFDENCSLAKTISEKVTNGFIRMASMYATVEETSSAPELALEGQVYETVTKCKLIEISIVPIGGNDDALKLSDSAGTVKLNKLKIKNENMSEFKTIALALDLAADASETVVLDKMKALKLSLDSAETKVVELQSKLDGIHTSTATTLVDKAIALGLIPSGLKAAQLLAFDSDFEGAKVILTGLIAEKEADLAKDSKQTAIKEVVLGGGASVKAGDSAKEDEECFDYLQKHDAVKLSAIRETEPEKYIKLAKDYANGVRSKK